jgi:FixJ family two-component response regulator
MCGMIATSHIENRATAQMRITPSEEPSPKVVCLVDDDPMVLRSTGRLLVSDGFAVRSFNNGEDFITYVASHEVPLVVLDIWMEEMTGLEVLARLCAISPQTHVIMMTGHEDSAARTTAMQIGIAAFLIKPFNADQFLEMVHRELSHPPEMTRSIKLAHNRCSRFDVGCLPLPHRIRVPKGRDGETCGNLVFGQERQKATTL